MVARGNARTGRRNGGRVLGARLIALVAGAAVVGGVVLASMVGGTVAGGSPAHAQASAEQPGAMAGRASGLPVPRFVSIKADKVNVRSGPSRDNAVAWVFTRAGLPVEVTAEFENWRRVRDSDGSEGWIYHSMLSGRRTALVTPWSKGDPVSLHASRAADSAVTARLESGVLGKVEHCDGKWCRFFGDDFDGFIEQEKLWGVYPGEKLD
ncbi:SH3 domain-containing protein [Ancylobacter sp. GSK1Z-4-2]|nr:SH3 domain-containing protein [Ancylobacter mangrovi]MCS0502698.1 SH3 domain-containing protein [Ancylobacter mangrovi]